jgi:hypothetical protein
MADDKSKQGKTDPGKAAKGADDEVSQFAKQYRLSVVEAQKLIQRHGLQRAAAIAAENRLSKKPSRY